MDDTPPNSSSLAASCALCGNTIFPTHRVNVFEHTHVCGDCKFLWHEDLNIREANYDRTYRGRLDSCISESVESILSQQYYRMMLTSQESQISASQQEFQPVSGNAADFLQLSESSCITPAGSIRWRCAVSDTESEELENFAFHFGDSESSASLGTYRFSHNETDGFSFSAYGGDSDTSVDRHSITDARVFTFPWVDPVIDTGSDTDIDPMHAGVSIWDSDEEEILEEEQEDMPDLRGRELTDSEEENTGDQLQIFMSSSSNETVASGINRIQQFQSSDSVDLIGARIRDRWETFAANIFTSSEGLDIHFDGGVSRHHLGSRGFEILLENFVENGIMGRGAPPASISFIDSLPCIAITEEQEKAERFACAICKDILAAGTEVNQLPCFHLYHPSCILPWLSSRNSCPLCRYELPTDDNEYEEGKRNHDTRLIVHEIVQTILDSSLSNVSADVGEDEDPEFDPGRVQQGQGQPLTVGPSIISTCLGSRGRWFFLAAAPIVSLVGIALLSWFDNPLTETRIPTTGRSRSFSEQNHLQLQSSVLSNSRENRSRRWWCIF